MPRAGFHPPSRADWLAARALLASRRLRPFAPFGLGLYAVVLATVYLVQGPFADRAAASQRAARRATAMEHDTLPLASALQAARSRLRGQDSSLQALQFRAEAQAAASTLSADARQKRDSLRLLVEQLDSALDRASKAPLSASYRALATTGALRVVSNVQSLVDTLELIDHTRQALDPVAAPQREFAQLSQRANTVGATLIALGHARRAALAQLIGGIESGVDDVNRSRRLTLDTAAARAVRDSASAEVSRVESGLRDARQWHTAVQARADSTARVRAARILGTSPFAATFAALVLVLVVSFTLAVAAEVRTPTVAHAREVERLTGVPVLATAERFRVPREGRERLQPGVGVDPFRMMYLALTASGTRERTVCVTGDDHATTTAVAARLAVSAAGDERATLVIDLAPGIPAASAYFGWRDEPGFTEAIAGVRLWREVARPIGASEGMAIDVIPAGSPRQDTEESVKSDTARAELTAFIMEYDITILVAPSPDSVALCAAACGHPPTILVARAAKTRTAALVASVDQFHAEHTALNGIVLIDA